MPDIFLWYRHSGIEHCNFCPFVLSADLDLYHLFKPCVVERIADIISYYLLNLELIIRRRNLEQLFRLALLGR